MFQDMLNGLEYRLDMGIFKTDERNVYRTSTGCRIEISRVDGLQVMKVTHPERMPCYDELKRARYDLLNFVNKDFAVMTDSPLPDGYIIKEYVDDFRVLAADDRREIMLLSGIQEDMVSILLSATKEYLHFSCNDLSTTEYMPLEKIIECRNRHIPKSIPMVMLFPRVSRFINQIPTTFQLVQDTSQWIEEVQEALSRIYLEHELDDLNDNLFRGHKARKPHMDPRQAYFELISEFPLCE